jgi:L-methionine (R)-S-oxide reductase
VDGSRLLDEVSCVLEGHGDRRRKAAGVAEAIRRAGTYRWVGIYEVSEEEIVNLAFSGPGPPMYPRFPITQGLSGAVVSSREAVVVGEVSEDPLYLTAFGSTRSEIIVPIVEGGKKVVGTIEVQSERKDAFSEAEPLFWEVKGGREQGTEGPSPQDSGEPGAKGATPRP